jgi:hypothetical protein
MPEEGLPAQLLPFSAHSMSLGDLRTLLLAVGRDWTLARFCEALGWEQDEYADGKFRELLALGLLLQRFEPDTLTQALEAYLLEARSRERARIVRLTPLAGPDTEQVS